MMYLLRRLHQFQSTDPRDRIFALIGIATDAHELGLRVNYSKSTEQVYAELARVLARNGSFDILSHRTQGGKTALPVLSWVPDWSAKTRCAPFQQRAVDRSAKPAIRTLLQPEFSAGRGQTQPDNLISDDGGHWERPLCVSAISVGDVQELGEPWRADGVGAWLESLQIPSRSSLSVLAESADRTVAVWRTAAADQDMRQHTTKPRLANETIRKLEQAFGHANLGSLGAQALLDKDFGSYSEQVNSVARGRRGFLTSLGDLAIGPEEAEPGDHIIVILGADVPFLVRRRYSGAGYHLIGEVYVRGYMDGEALGQSTSHEIVALH